MLHSEYKVQDSLPRLICLTQANRSGNLIRTSNELLLNQHCMAQWVVHLTRNRWMPVSCEFQTLSKALIVSLSKKLCLGLVGSRNGFKLDLHYISTLKLKN